MRPWTNHVACSVRLSLVVYGKETLGMKIVDGDGHVMEDVAKLAKFLDAPIDTYRHAQRIFPPLDHFHTYIGQMPDGSFRKVGPDGWLEFMEDVGIENTVLYTT